MYKQQAIRGIFLCLLLGLILPVGVMAQNQPQVSASTDTTSIRIGEQFKLHLSATVPAGQLKDTRIQFPQLPDSLDHFEVVSRSALDTSGNEKLKVLAQTITLTSFDSGHWALPPLKFEAIINGNSDSIIAPAISMDVNTVSVDTTKAFKPIKSVQAVPWSIWDYWPYMAIGAAAVLLILALIWFLRKPKKKAPVVVTPTVSPYELAWRELRSLKEEQLWQKGDIKQYYTRLTDILRTYFEHEFGIAALEQTSEELLQNIKPITKINQQRDKLRALLAIADLAKFAKLQPTADEHEDCMRKAEEILEWTKPKAPAAEGDAPQPAGTK
ncbi:hypothetical protein [Chitinophaga vietnamensis]|uniref:hypothetical protein n=1 Tax=Chitinophaga vietnamensis TaxID=2593957 RepID=UPI001177E891|nr:hypothetical protein [Chitinophaga vietnamensis]